MRGRRLWIGGLEVRIAIAALAAAVLVGGVAAGPALAEKEGDGTKEQAGDDRNKSKDGKGKKEDKWTSLFDGESLENWKVTQFGGQGDVHVEDGKIVLPFGSTLTGITWKDEEELPHRINYEIELNAKRVDGTDFFCGLTFPVRDDPCTLIVGGWGGGVTGLSSLDGYDASQNNTSQWINYKSGQWYHIRLRVTENKIESWLDGKKIIDADIRDKKLSIRPEVELSKPLGIASWQTTAALKDIRIRPVKKAADPVPEE